MKKQILFASAALAVAAFGGTFETWIGGPDAYRVNTGMGPGGDDDKSGYWFWYDDSEPGGASQVKWPEPGPGTEYGDNALDPVIDVCNGVCGTAVINAGELTYPGFVGIGFNLVGENDEFTDISALNGICFAYSFTGTAEASLEIGMGTEEDGKINGATYAAKLKTGTNNEVFKWSDFKQPTWASEEKGEKIEQSKALAHAVALKMKIQGKDGSNEFNIMAIGPANGSCEATKGKTSIGSVAASASAKAVVTDRILSFTGIDNAKVEILNLQGQVVLKGVASSSATMNLAGLDAGVYMVRVAGQKVSMNQKILVK